LTVAAASKKVWTILEMLQWGTSYLAEKGFDESRLTIEVLLSHVLRLKRIQLYTNFEKPLTHAELTSFKILLQRRLQHEPLQYIIGTTEFMGREFLVDKRVLIPRPETEVLAEVTIRYAKENFSSLPSKILDIGTGSGCLAVTCAVMIENAVVTAFDVDKDAIDVARSNAERNGVGDKIAFSVRDVFTAVAADFPEKFHLVISNPPYISKSEFEGLQPEIRKFEPPSATTDGNDGLNFYRCIAGIARPLLESNGAVIVEHAYNQASAVQEIFRDVGWNSLESVRDYSGIPRCIVAKLPTGKP
jgi:release factor glutamine methyltransferase